MHYVANPTCERAKIVATLTKADPGLIFVVPALLTFPDNIIESMLIGFNITSKDLPQLRAAVVAAGFGTLDP
jgi:hypothetical protein